MPFVAATGAYACARRWVGRSRWLLTAVWLLFFPNAPYVLTDFIHLHAEAVALIALTAFLVVGYVVVYAFAALNNEHADRSAGTEIPQPEQSVMPPVASRPAPHR